MNPSNFWTVFLWVGPVVGMFMALIAAFCFWRSLEYWKGRAKESEEREDRLRVSLHRSIANYDAATRIINRQAEGIVRGPVAILLLSALLLAGCEKEMVPNRVEVRPPVVGRPQFTRAADDTNAVYFNLSGHTFWSKAVYLGVADASDLPPQVFHSLDCACGWRKGGR